MSGLLVVSTDLPHDHDVETARVLDARTAAIVERLAIDALDSANACGIDALRAAMAWASLHGYGIERRDVHDWDDTSGDSGHVTGYGAFAIVEPSSV